MFTVTLRLRTLRSRANAAQQTSTGPSPSGSGAEPTLSPSIAESQKVVESERAPPAIQCAIYGAEMLSRAPVVPCAMGMLVQDDVVHVWIYDREGGIQSMGLNFLTDLPRFLVLLFAMQRLRLKDWGFIEKYDLGAIAALGETEPRKPPSPVKVDQFYIDTAVSIHRSLSLKGRGTYVVRARHARPPHGQSPHFVAKFSWADCSRLPERELVQRGIDRAAGNEAVTKHMPYIAHSFELRECTTRTVRAALGIPPKHRLRPDKSEGAEVYRILRVTIVEWMEHLSTLSNERFLRGWFQALIAHYHNWRNGVQHRDISLGNLMRRGKDEDPVCAVLNDWDLGNDAEDPNLTHTGFEVTGTVPFMAIDLLTQEALDGKVAILYRHDLEALIWVLIWAVCCYDDGKMVHTVPRGIYNWNVRDPLSCGEKKHRFLTRREPIQPASDNWGEGLKLASLLRGFLWDQMAKTVKDFYQVVHQQAWLQGSGPGFSHQTMPREEDDPERVWYEFWAHLKRFKEVVPCIADFMPEDLRKAGDADEKQ
ncbi:hypothetical protein C8Q70DRAFT_245141 [Cubamyces menziesii]|nr:hypothetical protein C8Q70DRAFT_245141 [Cubamyces menziesii]